MRGAGRGRGGAAGTEPTRLMGDTGVVEEETASGAQRMGANHSDAPSEDDVEGNGRGAVINYEQEREREIDRVNEQRNRDSQLPMGLGSVNSLVRRMRAPAEPPSTGGTRQQDETVIPRRNSVHASRERLSVSDYAGSVQRVRVEAEVYGAPVRVVNSTVIPALPNEGEKRKPRRERATLPQPEFRPDPTVPRRGKGSRYTERPEEMQFIEGSRHGGSRSVRSEGGQRPGATASRRIPKVSSDVDEYIRGGSPEPLRQRNQPAVRDQPAVAKGQDRKKKPTASEWFYIKPTDLCPGGELYISEKLMGRLKIDDAARRPSDDPNLYAYLPDELMDACKKLAIRVDRKGLEDRFYTQRVDGVVIVVNMVNKQWFDYHYTDFYNRNGRYPTDRPIRGEKPSQESMPRQQIRQPTRVRADSGGSVYDQAEYEIKTEIPEEHRTSTGMAGGTDRLTRPNTRGDGSGRVSPLEATLAQILAAQQVQSQRLADQQDRMAREQMATMREMRTSPVPFAQADGGGRGSRSGIVSRLPIRKFSGVDYVNNRLIQYQDWEREYEVKGGAEGLSKDSLAEKMVLLLQDQALEAYMGLPTATRKSWVLLSAAMKEKFDPDDSYTAKKNFHELKMLEKESAADYFTQIKRMARRAYPEMRDEWMQTIWKDAFLNGLPIMMQQVMIQKECANMTVEQCHAISRSD